MATEKDKPQGNRVGVETKESTGELPRHKKPETQAKMDLKKENQSAAGQKRREAVKRGEVLSRNAKKKALRKAAGKEKAQGGSAMEQ